MTHVVGTTSAMSWVNYYIAYFKPLHHPCRGHHMSYVVGMSRVQPECSSALHGIHCTPRHVTALYNGQNYEALHSSCRGYYMVHVVGIT